MSRAHVQRSSIEQRLGRVLQLGAFVTFCLFAAAIAWHYEGLESPTAAGQRQPAAASDSTPRESRLSVAASGATDQTASADRDQLTSAMATLRTGHFDFTIEYKDGSHVAAALAFDLNKDADHAPRMKLDYRYTYDTYPESRRVRMLRLRQVVIGDQMWQSSNSEPWPAAPGSISSPDHIAQYLELFLPHGAAMQNAQLLSDNPRILTWSEVELHRQMTVEIEPTSGVPLQMTRTDSSDGTVMTVAYSGWNTTEAISAP